MPLSVKEVGNVLENVRKDKDEALADQQYEYAAELHQREQGLREKLEKLEKNWQEENQQDSGDPVVTAEDIAEVASMWTGIPVTRLATEESQRLLQMEESLHKKVIGQDEAITLRHML